MTAQKYDHAIDLGVDNAHTRVIRLVGERKRVLELGCATGYMSKVLVERLGCTVTGIERDAEAVEKARKVCSRVIVGDLDTLDYARVLGEERFDVVICADVLEHLRDPVRTLASVRGFLSPGGCVVASIPNIAHVAVIAELLEGRFPYRPLGLLDDTHVRFFTRDSVYDCFEQAGFVIAHLERVRLEPEATEFRTDLSRFPPELVKGLRSHDESTTYQFILVARPAPAGDPAHALRDALAETGSAGAIQEATAEIAWPTRAAGAREAGSGRLAGLMEAVFARMKFLEGERERLARELDGLRTDLEARGAHVRALQEALAGREQQLAGLTAQVRVLQQGLAGREQELADLTAHLADLTAHLADLTAHLADLKSGLGWIVLERFRLVRLKILPRGSRSERLFLGLLRGFRRVVRMRP